MIVEPYKLRPAPPELAILRADGLVEGENGERWKPDRVPKGVQVWTSQERCLARLRAGQGRALCWRGQPIRYAAAGTSDYRVRVLALAFPDDERALAGLRRWRDWLASYGAAPLGSLGSSSMSLLRARLDRPLWTSVPFTEAPPYGFTLGGRQELGARGAPAEYAGPVGLWDMRAAYARTLAGLWYGGHWFRLHAGPKLDGHARLLASDPRRLVVCRARVRLPGTRPGPLVRRPRREPDGQLGFYADYPASGTIQGVWSFDELAAAEQNGARVRLLAGWFHVSDWQPFAPWWEAVEEGRRMDGFAGHLAKATGNALWGQFAISRLGRRQVLYYDRTGRRRIRELPVAGSRRPAHDLAECLTGRIRANLYRFIAAAGDRLCSAHTDGGWARLDGFTYADPAWRLKEQATRLRVLDPQVLAYRKAGELEDHYVVSGWPADGAAEFFEQAWAQTGRPTSRTDAQPAQPILA